MGKRWIITSVMRHENTSLTERKVKPFLKWAGGKRWLISNYPELLNVKYDRYVEPFLGSGAVYFHLMPQKALLSDINSELILTYKAIKNNYKIIEKLLATHHTNHSKDYYYHIRAYRPNNIYKIAARLIYLNRTCWNGLYRVNKLGQFNVPIGTKSQVSLDSDDFQHIAQLLENAVLKNHDFKNIIDQAGKGDFVFIDPPYTVCHNNNGFLKYNENIFSWDDQIRLNKAILRANNRGAKILLLNAYHQDIAKMYEGVGEQIIATRSSVLSGNPKYRKKVEELIVKSYQENN